MIKIPELFSEQSLGLLYIIFTYSVCMISACSSPNPKQKIIIIQDEIPQMKVLAKFLRENRDLTVDIVSQDSLPSSLSPYQAVMAYIHKELFEPTEKAIIDYTTNGGKFICLHHSISSGKAKNKYYFDFLGIQLDDPKNSKNPVEPGGGYAWKESVKLILLNLYPDHYITNHQVTWGHKTNYISSDHPSIEKEYPSITLEDSEVYLNHKFTDGREKTVLCGIKHYDERNGKLFMQDRGAWLKKSGKGIIIYFQPGHASSDYRNQNIAQMILNAVKW
jgi:hypothetical protein